jgi:hypothetical protein
MFISNKSFPLLEPIREAGKGPLTEEPLHEFVMSKSLPKKLDSCTKLHHAHHDGCFSEYRSP